MQLWPALLLPSKGNTTDLDGSSHEWPAFGADVALLPTRAHVIVVRQVYIKHKFPLHGHKWS